MLGIVEHAREIKARAVGLARLQLELATLELKRKAKAIGIAAALGIIALAAVLYAIGFVFAAIAAGLTEVVPLWASLLIVAFLLLLTAAVLLLAAARVARRAGPARPVETMEEAQTTARELRGA
jgi:putative superfamily III holin-X